MITVGYEIECDACHKKEYFPEGEDATLVGDWYYCILQGDGGHLCTDCWNSQENTRDEQAKLAQAEEIEFDNRHPYASAIRDNLNGEG